MIKDALPSSHCPVNVRVSPATTTQISTCRVDHCHRHLWDPQTNHITCFLLVRSDVGVAATSRPCPSQGRLSRPGSAPKLLLYSDVKPFPKHPVYALPWRHKWPECVVALRLQPGRQLGATDAGQTCAEPACTRLMTPPCCQWPRAPCVQPESTAKNRAAVNQDCTVEGRSFQCWQPSSLSWLWKT